MAELLPQHHPAVRALRDVGSRQISSTNLVILLGSPDAQANRRLAESLISDLQPLVPSVLTEIQVRPDDSIERFRKEHIFLYADKKELLAAEELVERLRCQRKNPLCVDLSGDASAELARLRSELHLPPAPKPSTPPAESSKDAAPKGFFEGRSTQTGLYHLGIMLWRRGSGIAAMDDRRLLQTIESLVRRHTPKQYHPRMEVRYTGPVAMALSEQDAVRNDLGLATAVCVSLVMLVVYGYFRKIPFVFLTGIPAFIGALWALGMFRILLPALNANTAFLISIIIGNGINTPIILLARYKEMRPQGISLTQICQLASKGTLCASLAASVAYGSLLLSSLPGLSQFGILGCVGMLLSWTSSFLLLPPLLVLLERRQWISQPGGGRPTVQAPKPRSLRFPAAAILGSVLLGSILMVQPARNYLRDPIEYNFANLRSSETEAQKSWAIMYELGLGGVSLGAIGTDAVLLADSAAQADRLAGALLAADQARGEKRVLKNVRSLSSLLPGTEAEQLEKIAILKRLGKDLAIELNHPLPELRPLGIDDLPPTVQAAFTEVDGTRGRLIGIDADPERFSDWNGHHLLRLSTAIQIDFEGKRYVAASSSTLFGAMVERIAAEAPQITVCAAVLVLGVLSLFFGLAAWPVVFSQALGLHFLLGLVGIFGPKLNFVNFVAIPLTLGIGADYGANLLARLRSGEPQMSLLFRTGPAVTICSLTTVIGYSALLFSRSLALVSFGKLANFGELTCLATALLVVPFAGSLLKKSD